MWGTCCPGGDLRNSIPIIPIVHVSKLKLVVQFPDRPVNVLVANCEDRVDFDESLLPEDSWENELAADEYEVEKILDVRSGRKTRYGRVHRKFWLNGSSTTIRPE